MKVVVELETYREIEKIERFLRSLNPELVKVHLSENVDRVKSFLDFIDNEATRVERIVIPNREERNARESVC